MAKPIRCPLAIALCSFSFAAAAGPVLDRSLTFDPEQGELPEGIAIDARGNLYVSFTPLGQVRRIAPSGEQKVILEIGMPGLTGIALDRHGAVYVAKQSTKPEQPRGVVRIAASGVPESLPGCDAILAPNGLAFDPRGRLYITDTAGGAVFRYQKRGRCELWFRDEVLAGDGSRDFDAGANGIAIREGAVFVANLEKGTIVRIPIDKQGEPGAAEIWVKHPDLIGIDGIAFGLNGELYAANVLESTLIRIDGASKTVEILATAADGLDNPASLAIGSRQSSEPQLYITNYPVIAPDTAPPGVLGLRLAGD